MSEQAGLTPKPCTDRVWDDERPLAVFDLDGTLIEGDSFLPFLMTYARKIRRVRPLLILPFVLALYVCRALTDRAAKEKLIVAFFRGEPVAAIERHASWFCKSWVRPRLRPGMLETLKGHLAAGHRVVLVSASPDLYVPCIARSIGIPETVCTRVLIERGACVGTLSGPNCKGTNKVTLLQAYLGSEACPSLSYAYGDSRSDFPLLRWVRHGVLVKRGKVGPVPANGA